jgi:hypothetical protein
MQQPSTLITRRRLQVALGLIWLLDGGLQLQPFMFSGSFLPQAIEPAAQGQPSVVATGVLDAAHLMSRHLAVFNAGAAAIQLIIGIGLLFPRTVKPALALSFGWALGVWAFGEGFGLLLTGEASPLTGAPGAVILYALAGLLVWPVDRPRRRSAASQGLLGDRGGRVAWAVLWCGLAALSMLPANCASGAVSGAFEDGGNLDAALGRASAGHGLPITVLLAGLELGIGTGMLTSRWRNVAALLGAALALAVWVTAQGAGGLTTGQATDPNTGPLLVLLSAALYLPATARPRRERRAGDAVTGARQAGGAG